MTSLVACLGEGKGTWKYISELISKEQWDSVFLVTNPFGAQRFSMQGRELHFVVVDDRKAVHELMEDIRQQLSTKLSGTEVALNMVSGEGKLHMALLSALLRLGLGIRQVILKNDSVEEL